MRQISLHETFFINTESLPNDHDSIQWLRPPLVAVPGRIGRYLKTTGPQIIKYHTIIAENPIYRQSLGSPIVFKYFRPEKHKSVID